MEEARRADMVERPLEAGGAVLANPLRFRIGPNETESILVRFAPMTRPAP